MRAFGMYVLAGALWASPCSAEWIHEKGEVDPFKGGAEQTAAAIEISGFMAAFRCAQGSDLEMVFVAPEKPDPNMLKMLSLAPMKLMVIVDDDPKVVLSAVVGSTLDGSAYRLASDGADVATLVHKVANAKRRLALAGAVGDKIAWSHVFSVAGSRRAIQPLIEGCGIAAPKPS